MERQAEPPPPDKRPFIHSGYLQNRHSPFPSYRLKADVDDARIGVTVNLTFSGGQKWRIDAPLFAKAVSTGSILEFED